MPRPPESGDGLPSQDPPLTPSVRAVPSGPADNRQRWRWLLPLLLVVVSVVGVYHPVLSAGFVAFDDDIHVYANPHLNPPTLESLRRFWQEPYEKLYVPLAYSIFAAVAHLAQVPSHFESSIGQVISVNPVPFHQLGLGFHLVNALLCYELLRRLTHRPTAAILGTLLFVLHPLQVESVAWISELRGLSSSCFALAALLALVVLRQKPERSRATVLAWGTSSTVAVLCALLCKPTAVVLPFVAILVDRIALMTAWRKTVALASVWAAVALPFAWMTRSIQSVPSAFVPPIWQRPFIAGDALSFYLYKLILPFNLGVDHGRTPQLVMSQAYSYVTWLIPVTLLAGAYYYRRERPFIWLGGLLFVAFLLPTLGFVPFAHQAYSTVADRYLYLAMVGLALVLADCPLHKEASGLAFRLPTPALVLLAILSFRQSQFWIHSADFLRHTIEVNPDAAFAYNNLGDIELANGDYAAAMSNYQACVERDRTRVKAYINLAEIHALNQNLVEAERAISQAIRLPNITADDLSNLGIVLMKLNQPERALEVLLAATTRDPRAPSHFFNYGSALSGVGQFEKAEHAFRRCIALAPTLAGAHTGLGIVLAETHRLPEALAEFRTALRLQPNDPAARDNLRRAEAILGAQGG